MVSIALAFVVSLVITGLIVRRSRQGSSAWDDHDTSGAQKSHARPVPRLGGLGVADGLAAVTFFLLGAQLSEVQLAGLDWLMSFTLFSLLFTMLALAGVGRCSASSCGTGRAD